jgi:hypothetical protein
MRAQGPTSRRRKKRSNPMREGKKKRKKRFFPPRLDQRSPLALSASDSTHLEPLPVSDSGTEGSKGLFSAKSCDRESPAFGLFVVVVVVIDVDDDAFFARTDVPKKSTSGSGSEIADPRRDPSGVCLFEPPGLEALLVRRERARRMRPRSVEVDVGVGVGSSSLLRPATKPAPPPPPPLSMTRATVVSALWNACRSR